MRGAILLGALAACSFPTKSFSTGSTDASADAPPGTADAPPGTPDANPAFACLGQPLPTTAPATISFSGSVSDPLGGSVGATNVSVELTCCDPIQVISDASGAFGPVSQATNGAPLTGYTMFQQSGYLTTFVYPAVPFDADTTISAEIATASQFAQIAGFTDDVFDTGKAQLLITVVDCTGRPISGATVSTQPVGTVRYLAGSVPSATAAATDSSGAAIVYNIEPGSVTVAATAMGVALRAHAISGGAGSLTETAIQP